MQLGRSTAGRRSEALGAKMLREIKETSQNPGEPRRRWFSGSTMDLYIWQNEEDEIVSYQLTYDKPHAEKALVWKKDKGFSHLGVDDGQNPGKHPGSPLFVEDGILVPSKIISGIMKYGDELDPTIKEFIVSGIEEHFG